MNKMRLVMEQLS